MVKDSNLIQEFEEGIADSSFTSLLNSYGVSASDIVQTMWFAKSESLRRVFEFHTSGDALALKDGLTELSNSELLFDDILLNPKEVSMYDPGDYMWTSTSQYLWHLKKIEADKAWDITKGRANVRVAVVDDGLDQLHPDLGQKVYPVNDFFKNGSMDPHRGHGTSVASFLAAETVDAGQNANGQLASVGYNTHVMFAPWSTGSLAACVYASSVKMAKIINVSWFQSSTASKTYLDAEKEINDNGTLIVKAAGNGNHHAQGNKHYPFSGKEDDRTLIVSGTDKYDKHKITGNPSATQSDYPEVDLCAPSYGLMGAVATNGGASTWPYYGSLNGTSFGAPIVSGTAALMLSVNSCLANSQLKDILKNTVDPIADANNFKGVVGTGRVNAYKAVKVAQKAYTTTLDLFIKDVDDDFGDEIHPYSYKKRRDLSPDIWIRNQSDGFNVFETQSPEYSTNKPVYVYVRIRNKSCVTSTGNEKLSLYWTKASSWTSWPNNWNGSNPLIGNKVKTVMLPKIKPGEEKVIEIPWHVPNPTVLKNWSTCLLARIENSSADGITAYPGRQDDDVYYNNNVAMKNVAVVDLIPNAPITEIQYGRYTFIGNPESGTKRIDLAFISPRLDNGNTIVESAEVSIEFDQDGWNFLNEKIQNTSGIEIIEERRILVLEDSVVITDINFDELTQFPIFIKFNFLTEENTLDDEYEFELLQFPTNDSAVYGGVKYIVCKIGTRNLFFANAGQDKSIFLGDSITLSAAEVNESVTYNWYSNATGELINSNKSIVVQPNSKSKYTLEVIANSDGYKDYDTVNVDVRTSQIVSVSPNPTSNSITVDYIIQGANTAELMLLNSTGTYSQVYGLSPISSQYTVDVSAIPAGIYSIVLLCDLVAIDSKQFVKQ